MNIKKERQLFLVLVFVILLVFLGGAAGGIITFSLLHKGYLGEVGEPVKPVKLKYSSPTTFTSDFQKTLQTGLVKIISYRVLGENASILDESFINDKIISSGFLVSSDGWLVTSYLPKSSFSVLNSDGRLFSPESIVGVQSLGLSFVKIGGRTFPNLSLGDERDIVFGDDVFTIQDKKVFKSSLAYFGYPDFLKKNDSILSSEAPNKFLFLKDELNDNAMGLPIFSKKGEIIGAVNNNGLIIPINLVKLYLNNLWKNKALNMPYLGVKYFDLSVLPLKVKDIDLKKGAYIFKGDEVSDAIARKSPAQKAGLRGGDIILSVMGDEINENYNLAERLLEYSAGDKVDLEILRNGEKMELSVELGEQK